MPKSWRQCSSFSLRYRSVVANTVESSGENVEEQSTDELLGRESHDFLLIVIAVVAPVEPDLPAFDIHDPMVGNSNAVSVAADAGEGQLSNKDGSIGSACNYSCRGGLLCLRGRCLSSSRLKSSQRWAGARRLQSPCREVFNSPPAGN